MEKPNRPSFIVGDTTWRPLALWSKSPCHMLSVDCVLRPYCGLAMNIIYLIVLSKRCIYYPPPRFSRGQCDVFSTTTVDYTDHTEIEEVGNITIPLRAHVQVCSFGDLSVKIFSLKGQTSNRHRGMGLRPNFKFRLYRPLWWKCSIEQDIHWSFYRTLPLSIWSKIQEPIWVRDVNSVSTRH